MKKKNIIIIIAIVIFLVLCIPVRLRFKDGGTVEYCAVLYCVTKRHSLWSNTKGSQGYLPEVEEGAEGYITGLEIEIFGIEIYSDLKFEERR